MTVPMMTCTKRSPLSARAPVSGVSSSCGVNWATLTRPTMNAEPVRSNTRIAPAMLVVHTASVENTLPAVSAPTGVRNS